MQTNIETEIRLSDAEPYVRVQASRYETSFAATERAHDGDRTVKVVLPRAARQVMMNAIIAELGNLRHADCDDQGFAVQWLTEAQSRISEALRRLRPEAASES